jgi:hypothetical protein
VILIVIDEKFIFLLTAVFEGLGVRLKVPSIADCVDSRVNTEG